MITTSLIATIDTPLSGELHELAEAADAVGSLEVRADLVGDIPEPRLRERFPGSLIYSLRSAAEGGSFDGDASARRELLAAAAEKFDLVELEGERDLLPEILEVVPAAKRIISWHGASESLARLDRRLDRYTAVPAALYRLVPDAASTAEALLPLRLLAARRRADIIAYASGRHGSWTRVIAPHFGAPVVFAPIVESGRDPFAFGIRRLMEDYGLPLLRPVKQIFGIIGTAVAHSLSPRLHNAGYRELGYPALYFPFHAERLAEFRAAMEGPEGLAALGIRFGGGTIAAPHKEDAVAAARMSNRLCVIANAANNIVVSSEAWIASTTDSVGVQEPLMRRGIPIAGLRVLIVGCGGAGRAIAASLKLCGARVTLMNRGRDRGLHASRLLGLPLLPFSEDLVHDFDVVINATSVGRNPEEEPFSVRSLPAAAIVIDLIYGASTTRLISEARERGMTCIDGREVLRAQALAQFRLLTGLSLPRPIVDGILGRDEQAVPSALAVPGS